MKSIKSIFLKSLIAWIWFSIAIVITGIVYAAIWHVTIWDKLDSWTFNNIIDATVPTWFVWSFDLTICPNWWTEYIPARWRFIRWIDSTWTNDVVRVVWDLQADDFKSHSHTLNWITLLDLGVNKFWHITWGARKEGVSITNWTWWTETRPKNVALLFCEKN